MRNRYYDPIIGRFTQEDTHWNVNNMLYGDNPVKWNERKQGDKDSLGLNTYTYKPDIMAIMQSGNMYVYCMGNPLRYVDPTGDLAWPGEIHNQVVNHIANSLGFYKEQRIDYRTVNNRHTWGRADLISSSGMVWDVKRDKPGQIAAGEKQVLKYVEGEWKNAPAYPYYTLSVGGFINPSSFVYETTFTTYYVTYRFAGNGVIAYDYYEVTDWEKVGETAKGIVIIGGAAFLIFVTAGAAAPLLEPIL